MGRHRRHRWRRSTASSSSSGATPDPLDRRSTNSSGAVPSTSSCGTATTVSRRRRTRSPVPSRTSSSPPDLGVPVDKDNALDVAAALAATVTRSADRFGALVLTGGETARAVLDALGIDTVRVHGTVEPGVVLSSHPDHRPVLVTKAGGVRRRRHPRPHRPGPPTAEHRAVRKNNEADHRDHDG
ncbi:nucleotide-binding domain containing protein [Curtobacterium sp. MCPF17_052]|uniref:nucleotide-binding domain containing protein n=1 Tax=Curtobacterium sp. MCPF17_052 TaxID=2175655 RepID=UPI00346396FA